MAWYSSAHTYVFPCIQMSKMLPSSHLSRKLAARAALMAASGAGRPHLASHESGVSECIWVYTVPKCRAEGVFCSIMWKNQSREPYQLKTPEPPTPQQPDKPSSLWTWNDVALIAGSSIVLLLLGIAISGALMPNTNPQHPANALNTVSFTINGFIVEFIVLVGSVYLLGLRRKKLSWHALGLRPLSRAWIVAACGLGIIEYLLETGVSYGFQYLFKLPDNTQLQSMATRGLTWINMVVLIGLAGLAIPFAEELLFRGVIYTFIRERWGVWIGTIISAFIYALISFDLLAGAAAFVLGVVTAIAYERSKSLWAAVIVHVTSSVLSLILFYIFTLPGMHVPVF